MLLLILILTIILHLLIGLYDFSFYRIPNLFLLAMLVLYVVYALFYLTPHLIVTSLIIFVILLALSFYLYVFKIIGAGDAKYISVTSLWFGFQEILPLLYTIFLMGGALALMYGLLKDPLGRWSDLVWLNIQKAEASFPWLRNVWIGSGTGPERGKRENVGSRMIPYGIAIAVGSIIMLVTRVMV